MACRVRSRLTWAGVAIAALLAGLLSWAGPAYPATGECFVGYLYVEPNEGDSSGGHVALRFGTETFHFQHESPGILRLQRHDWAAFRYLYGSLGNRAISESRISVSKESYTLLRDAFARRLVVQDAQLEVLDALHKDVVLFDLLLRRQRYPQNSNYEVPVPVSGAGYFLTDAAASSGSSGPVTTTSPALVALRRRLIATYGASFLPRKGDQVTAQLQGLQLRAAAAAVPEVSPDRFPSFELPVAVRLQDALRARLALQLLAEAPPLREGAFWSSDDDAFKMTPEQLLALKKYAADLEDDLVNLVASSRPEWGFPFILGMARLAALEASLASHRLVLLDLFPPDGYLSPRQDRALRPYLPMMRDEMRGLFARKAKTFFGAGRFREAGFAALERSGNLFLDVERSLSSGAPLRAVPKDSFPSRAATVLVRPPGEPEEATLMRELSLAQAAEARYAALLKESYGYDLFRHNCVTELFAVLNGALLQGSAGPGPPPQPAAGAEQRLRGESTRRLGGYVDAGSGLAFIPLVSLEMVDRSYTVGERLQRPSYRAARVAQMKRREPQLKVFLRESNTVTSSVYRPGADDSAFLFFTDDTILLRPVFGAFNLLTGLAEGLLGVATLPVAGPERVLSGARGMLFSLPELFFVNLRKGSMAYVEEDADGA